MQTASCDSLITPWEVKFSLRWGKNINLRREGGTGLPDAPLPWFIFELPLNMSDFFSKKDLPTKNAPKIYQKINTDFGNRWISLPPKTHRNLSFMASLAASKVSSILRLWCDFWCQMEVPNKGPSIWMWATKKKTLTFYYTGWLVGILIMVSLSYSIIIPMYLGSVIPPQKTQPTRCSFFVAHVSFPLPRESTKVSRIKWPTGGPQDRQRHPFPGSRSKFDPHHQERTGCLRKTIVPSGGPRTPSLLSCFLASVCNFFKHSEDFLMS